MCTQKHRSEVSPIKKEPFENVVAEQTAWLLQFVRKHADSRENAEDMVQEIWIRAFRAYDSYYEDGWIRHWLARIAMNHIRSAAVRGSRLPLLSLDAFFPGDEDDSLYACLSDRVSPEDECLRRELVNEVLAAVAKLPEAQRQVITHRYLNGLSLEETAAAMQIPKGTVKSKAHYAIGEIRKMLGLTDIGNAKTNHRKGVSTMECKEMYKYLFMYAMGRLSDENTTAVREHLKECTVCADIVTALEKLIPTMTFAPEEKMSHFNIHFPQYHLAYTGMRSSIDNYEECNRRLAAWDGHIPEEEIWLSGGFGKPSVLLGSFDNEGNEIAFRVYEEDERHCRVKATYIRKLYPQMWLYEAFMNPEDSPCIARNTSPENPRLFHSIYSNAFGCDAKSALYEAIPASAEEIKIRRGSGVLDCGPFRFACTERYIAADETLTLEYTYLQGE
ncbi:MAG: sigma-70 family RNA polymerase sigma factor [Eubacteriales bacterium]